MQEQVPEFGTHFQLCDFLLMHGNIASSAVTDKALDSGDAKHPLMPSPRHSCV